MIEWLTDFLIKRRLKSNWCNTDTFHENISEREIQFRRVLNTLNSNRIMVRGEADGIYVRMAGSIEKGEAFSLIWGKVIDFEDKK